MAPEKNGKALLTWAIELIILGIIMAGGVYAMHSSALARTDVNLERIHKVESRQDKRDEEMRYFHKRVDEMHADMKAVRQALENRGWITEGVKP